MIYSRIDVSFRDHPKALAAGSVARDLWVWGNLYCRDHQLNGSLPRSAVLSSPWGAGGRANAKVAEKLASVGLWTRTDVGWDINNYAAKNDTKEVIEAKKEAHRERMRRAREIAQPKSRAISQTAHAISAQTDHRLTKSESESESESVKEKESSPTPTTVRVNPKVPSKKDPRRTPLPEAFGVSDAIEKMCLDEGLPDPHEVIKDFRSKSLANGYRYIDWEQAFRSWMRSKITRDSYPPMDKPLPIFRAANREAHMPKAGEDVAEFISRTAGAS